MPAAGFCGFAVTAESCVFEDGTLEAEAGEAGAAKSELVDAEEVEAGFAGTGLSAEAGVVFGFAELLDCAVRA